MDKKNKFYLEGVEDYNSGILTEVSCPYEAETDERAFWFEGFDDARRADDLKWKEWYNEK